MFHTTDPTPSPSLFETLCRHIVDHHTLSVICSLCPSRQFLSLWHPTICEITLTLSSAFHLSMDSAQHMYAYPASWITVMHGADTICSASLVTRLSYYSTCYFLLFHMLLFIIPHAISKYSTCLLPFITYHVSSLQYISFEYLSCISPVSNIKSSSPLLSHFASEV